MRFFESNEEIKKNAYCRDDGKDLKTRVALWSIAGDDLGKFLLDRE